VENHSAAVFEHNLKNRRTHSTVTDIYKKRSYYRLAPYAKERYAYRQLTERRYLGNLDKKLAGLQFSKYALQRVLSDYFFETVLDLGSGAGQHSALFAAYGKRVTAVDFGKSKYFVRGVNSQHTGRQFKQIVVDFNSDFAWRSLGTFDVVWASQVLEHQLDPHSFLVRLVQLCKEGGVIMVSVPTYKSAIVGGHVSVWNAGLLMYHMIHAGLDCSDARISQEKFQINLLLKKLTINQSVPWAYDSGDINLVSKYLPHNFKEKFNGEISYMNW